MLRFPPKAETDREIILSNPYTVVVIEHRPGGRYIAFFHPFAFAGGDDRPYEPRAEGSDLEDVKRRAIASIRHDYPNKREFEFWETDGQKIVSEEIRCV